MPPDAFALSGAPRVRCSSRPALPDAAAWTKALDDARAALLDGHAQAARVALAAAPFDRVEVRLRTAEESQARSDPVARSASGLLAGTALAVLVIAALALVLLVVGEHREDAARSCAWEADGVTPRQLRATLWWRAVAVAAMAVPLGIAVGIGLSGATARLVAVTAVAGSPQPPLTAATGVGWAVSLMLAGSAGALLVAGVIAGSMMRERFPTRVWSRR